MIKITFEISEDFVRENSDMNKALEGTENKNEVLTKLTDAIAFSQLDKKLKKVRQSLL